MSSRPPKYRGFAFLGRHSGSTPNSTPSVIVPIPKIPNNLGTLLVILKKLRVEDSLTAVGTIAVRMSLCRGSNRTPDLTAAYEGRSQDNASDIIDSGTSYWTILPTQTAINLGFGGMPEYPPVRYEMYLVGLKGDANVGLTARGSYQSNLDGSKLYCRTASSFISAGPQEGVTGLQLTLPNANFHFQEYEVEFWSDDRRVRV